TGTMPNKVASATVITPSTADQTIPQGYYGGAAGDGKVLGDLDLVTGNIRAGANIFGVVGKTEVVDTAEGLVPAAAGNILSGKKAYVNGALVTGTMTNKVGSATVLTPSTADQAIPAGYYGGVAADGKVAGDTDLVAANIKTGVNIFGVDGSFTAKRYATGSTSTMAVPGTLSIRGLAFQPTTVMAVDSSGTVTWYSINITPNVCQKHNGSSVSVAAKTLYADGIDIQVTMADGRNYSWVAYE
ncbi:MAG: hypothetical protein ACYC0N_00585, partial [Carboxydocellales bacterium]